MQISFHAERLAKYIDVAIRKQLLEEMLTHCLDDLHTDAANAQVHAALEGVLQTIVPLHIIRIYFRDRILLTEAQIGELLLYVAGGKTRGYLLSPEDWQTDEEACSCLVQVFFAYLEGLLGRRLCPQQKPPT